MAALFRSLGVQIAPMWLYGLTPAAEYLGGSHYLNLYCTPRKAVSFRIAGEVFRSTPRYTPYPVASTDEIVTPTWAVSFARDLSLWSGLGAVMHSGPLDWAPLPLAPHPQQLVGYGSSPFVAYEGTGAYFADIASDRIELSILPDAVFVRPPWQKQTQKPWERTCALNPAARHPLTLRLPDWPAGSAVIQRLDAQGATAVPAAGPELRFEAGPGAYRLDRR
jgi:hypothetical protein